MENNNGWTNQRTAECDMQRDFYRCRLSEIPSTNGSYDLTALEAAAAALAPHSDIDLKHEIYAIVPLASCHFTQSLIIYEHYILFVDLPPYQIIKWVSENYHKLDHSLLTQALTQLMQKNGQRKYKIPFATAHYSLIPLTNSRDKETIWLNPGQLDHYSTSGLDTMIHLHNGLTFLSPLRWKSLVLHFYHGFIAHGIIKREYLCPRQEVPTSLVEFLALPPSKEIHRILKKLSPYDLPGDRGDFNQLYLNMYAEKDSRFAC